MLDIAIGTFSGIVVGVVVLSIYVFCVYVREMKRQRKMVSQVQKEVEERQVY